MKDYVAVTSWVRDDSRTIVASPERGGRYSIFPSGELHIRSANIEDGFKSYRCVTRNRLTGEVAPSTAAGKLFVTGKYRLQQSLYGKAKMVFLCEILYFFMSW
ncbi:down syndrome cell adhesion molecule-like protein 1 [Trichonephila clavata]|uniref:Down syndrome cell adhesion molecule-like protein 1 n=1 Tax=Trichonephila clavata TaxID=2740835 RepID=A0A8X6FR97_TRICU|nr:down syndrome cell adhesion molecule-like protein 1 [Trichonephila clavata]